MVNRPSSCPWASMPMATSEPVFTALVNGVPFAWVYKGPFLVTSVPAGAPDDGEPDVDPPTP